MEFCRASAKLFKEIFSSFFLASAFAGLGCSAIPAGTEGMAFGGVATAVAAVSSSAPEETGVAGAPSSGAFETDFAVVLT